jgi:LysM repeat protein
MSGVEAMIKKMESMLGTVGRPNTATRWYAARNGSYYANAPWCNMTITWAAYHSGNYDAVCFGKDYAYTVYHAQRFQAAGQWHVDTAGIRRGDIVFFDWGGSNNIGNIDHIGIVTDVNGRDILTIEGNTSDRCARRVRHAAEIVGYGRPKYKDPTPPVGEAPQQTWEYTVVEGDTLSKIGERLKVKWEDIAKLNGLRNPDAIDVGQKLRIPGRPPATTPPPAPPKPPADDEPAHDYRRVSFGGHTINVRTKVMLERAQKLLTAYDWTPRLVQGSYNKGGVAASAGTHDGGGVIDVNTDTMTKNGADICVQALRKAGFAAWRRGDGDGMDPHIHAVAIGDKELSSAAKSQIVQWRNDTNGLANRGPDPAPDPYPAWTQKYR